MAISNPTITTANFVPTQWIGRDGMPLTCTDKIGLLNHHLHEIHEKCQEAFEEALQMGCSEEFLRIVLQNMVHSLQRTSNGERPFHS